MADTTSTTPGRAPEPGDAPEQRSADEAFARAQVSPWTRGEQVKRAVWMVVRSTVFRHSWHNMYAWRRWVLRLFGARIGRRCIIRPSVHVEIPWNLEMADFATLGDEARVYNLGPIRLGRRVTVSQRAHLCAGTHDFSRADMPLIRPAIVIGDDAWVAADAFVGPGVTVGGGSVVGARACVFKDVEAWAIMGGNPARVIGTRPKPT